MVEIRVVLHDQDPHDRSTFGGQYRPGSVGKSLIS
jgi:hypothetical protein